MALCRELTKKYEEFIRGTVSEFIQWASEQEVRGEFCLIIEKGEPVQREEEIWWENFSVTEHVEHYIQEKEMTSKEAIKTDGEGSRSE